MTQCVVLDIQYVRGLWDLKGNVQLDTQIWGWNLAGINNQCGEWEGNNIGCTGIQGQLEEEEPEKINREENQGSMGPWKKPKE